ncbi:DNA polymerase/3'-5' exonuclease PolX [Halobacteriales archaeon QS_1_68_20]|nr:MAG: DNA polymerase/3'-5' exonuclease PolX [Halobacteriales archaeon QS_1_68_20]
MTGERDPPGITNADVAAQFEAFADLLEAKDVEYKPRAYRRAAENIRAHARPVAEIAREDPDALQEIDRVGEAIAEKIVEYAETGEIGELEELRAELPVDMAALTSVEGVGPKTVGSLYDALGITDLDDLEAAAREGKIQEVSGFGAKTEQNILEGIEFARQVGERHLLGEVRPLADDALAHLDVDAVQRVEVAGSIRRWQETIGDVDLLVATGDDAAVVDRFVEWPAADEVIEAGDQKASVRADGARVDLRAVDPSEFGAALQYFTGDVDHNVHLRNVAIDRDLKMNEYGVFDVTVVEDPDAGQRVGERIAGETEQSMYAALDLPWIPPEMRRDTGEIEAAASGELPALIEEGEIRGDLHTHTEWSDGNNTVAEMVQAAADFGYDYHAVTDHAAGAGTPPAIGLDSTEVREQIETVEAVAADAPIEVFHGVEANVTADGGLSPDADVLGELDLVIASPHAALGQDYETATERLVGAVEDPRVDVLGHPSGRLIHDRPGLEFDVERVARAAADHGVALEVNANPHRLDLWGDAVQRALDAGATIAIDTDAHSPPELAYVRYGVHTARRGWAEPADVLNARDVEGVREFLG